nr:Cro/CI family transcriptional regulator [uncultured Rhodoferax sp.]
MKHEKIISDLGGVSEVARLCEVTPQAVSQWTGVNPENGEKREIPKARLMYLKAIRPDVFATTTASIDAEKAAA